jgi:hypothetical protein
VEGAVIEMTRQEQQAIDAGGEPRLVDPLTQKAYVLVEADELTRLRGQAAGRDDLDPSQVGILVERAMREDDADDPTLEYYQQTYGRSA